jgi:CRP-like cAMP-binding protein
MIALHLYTHSSPPLSAGSFAPPGVGLLAPQRKGSFMKSPSSSQRQQPYRNCVLASLPAPDIGRLAPHLAPVSLQSNRSLHDPGEVIDTVYFLEEGISSVVVEMEDGTTIEVGVIGRDGFVGLPAVMGNGRSTNRTFMQIPGHGFKVKARVLREQCETSSELRSCLQRAIQAFLVQTAQTAACNRAHELEARMARWLLMCHDRVQSDRMPLTHELLAMMLGTTRSSVTIAAGVLNKAGLIAYTRGYMTIQDRERLQQAACECYSTVYEEYRHLGLL